MRIRVLLLSLLCFFSTAVMADFGFDEMEELEQTEQSELLELARSAAGSWDFTRAGGYLEQARNKGYAPGEIAAVEAVIAHQQDRRAEQRRREAEQRRLAEEARQREQQQARQARQARLAASRGGGGSGGSTVRYVMVDFDVVCGVLSICDARDLKVWGGPGNFSPSWSGSSSGAIHKGYNGALAGSYQWSAGITRSRACSGSFSISGTRSSYMLRVYKSCDDAGSREY